MTNSFENQVSILAELWMNYRDDKQMEDFIQYNDLGLPLAYLIHNEMVEAKELSNIYIEESYGLLLNALGVEDQEYDSLDNLLATAAKNEE